jgi:hypothetical protein
VLNPFIRFLFVPLPYGITGDQAGGQMVPDRDRSRSTGPPAAGTTDRFPVPRTKRMLVPSALQAG